jgi:hypothetical protein
MTMAGKENLPDQGLGQTGGIRDERCGNIQQAGNTLRWDRAWLGDIQGEFILTRLQNNIDKLHYILDNTSRN